MFCIKQSLIYLNLSLQIPCYKLWCHHFPFNIIYGRVLSIHLSHFVINFSLILHSQKCFYSIEYRPLQSIGIPQWMFLVVYFKIHKLKLNIIFETNSRLVFSWFVKNFIIIFKYFFSRTSSIMISISPKNIRNWTLITFPEIYK